jgi:cytochrome P450
VKDNIVEGLEYDTVMDFEYLHQCYYESLRIEPPISVSLHQTMSEDTYLTVNGEQVLFKKDQIYLILINEIHHDPIQWKEPHRYIPERFDTHDATNTWTQTSEGKPRNPLAFTPFSGGKRVCLGKTFAEVTIRFTVPLIY